jgi:signal transduction histidine kinase/HPt (histidine-containing phosphotransfer) domain-containing protein
MRHSTQSPARPQPVPVRATAMAWISRLLANTAHLVGENGAALVGLCGVVVLWTSLLYSLSVERQAAIDDAFLDTNHYARAFQQQITGIVRAIDQTLLYVRASYIRAPDQFDIAVWSEHGEFLTNPAFQVSITDKNGQLRFSCLGPITSPIDLSDREQFRAQAMSTGDQMFISKPVRLRIVDKWAIQFTRRIAGPDGAFAGVVTVSFDPFYLTRFYESLNLGSEDTVALVGTDGIVRARAPVSNQLIGHSLATTPLMRLFAENPNGRLDALSVVDGIRRVYSYRAVEGYPLLVVVGMSERDVLAKWDYDQRTHLAMACLVTAALLIVIISIARHQTRLRHARKALMESEARHSEKSDLLDVTLQNMDQGIIKMDANQVVQVVNRRMAELFDLTENVATGPHTQPEMLKYLWERGDYGRDDPDFATWFDRFALAGGYGGDGHPYELFRPNGRVIEVRGRSLADGGSVQTFTDITGRKQAEDALLAARDEADRSSRAKSEFLAMMSHEIRSPMSGLLGVIDLLRDTPLVPDQLEMIELVHGSAASLLRVVNDILDFSKIDAGGMAVNLEATALRPLIAAIVEPSALAAAGKGLRFTSEVAEDVPASVMLDPLRLRQILVNLLTNAIKFTSAGAVRLDVASTVEANGERSLSFAITDSGIGMSAGQLGRLFEPFSQADASTTKIYGGTGLGLTISRRLARLLGGDITVTSESGVGSVFRFRLGLVRAGEVAAKADDETAAADALLVGPRRVLVAEDQATNRWLIQHQLERLGCSVHAVENGRAALAALETADVAACRYDLLISDCHMPELDGIALTLLIRRGEVARGVPRLPILGLTADVSTAMRTRCLEAGMTGVVAKPIDLRRLRVALMGIPGSWDDDPAGAKGEETEAVFEPTALRELFADNDNEGREWLAFYLDTAAGLVSAVERNLHLNDRHGLAASAHNLASASLAAGAIDLGRRGRRVEAAAPNARLGELRNMVDGLVAAWRKTRLAINDFVTHSEAAA